MQNIVLGFTHLKDTLRITDSEVKTLSQIQHKTHTENTNIYKNICRGTKFDVWCHRCSCKIYAVQLFNEDWFDAQPLLSALLAVYIALALSIFQRWPPSPLMAQTVHALGWDIHSVTSIHTATWNLINNMFSILPLVLTFHTSEHPPQIPTVYVGCLDVVFSVNSSHTAPWRIV